ncbi:MAG: hypothetical protein IPM81_22880 [Saprospirales bacterium]|nr:hypothetical protein [Saprospirales bacterium]
MTGDAAFSAPYMLHRTNASTMFLGGSNMWRSTNVNAIPATTVAWDSLGTFPAGLTIRVIEQSPVNLDIVYMSRATGGSSVLYRSDNVNAAATAIVWNVITKPGGQALPP